jgi:hypothetical protein
MVTFQINNMDGINIKPWGALGKVVTLPASDSITFYVGKDLDTDFRKLLDSEVGISFEITIHYKFKEDFQAFMIPTSSGKMNDIFDRSLVSEVSKMANQLKEAEKTIEELQKTLVSLKKPIMWSGGSTSHGQGSGWIKYLTNGCDFNNAEEYVRASDNGTFIVKTAGFYRINFFCMSSHTGYAHIRILKDGNTIHQGYEYTKLDNAWSDNFVDLTWPFNVGETFWIEVYSDGGGNKYAYHSWNAQGCHSRVQVQYVGALK